MIFHLSEITKHKFLVTFPFYYFFRVLPSNPTSHFQENKPNYIIKHQAAENTIKKYTDKKK